MASEGRAEAERARKEAAEKIGEVLGATRTLLEPLKDLTESQIAAVATLEVLMRIATLAQRPALKLGDDILSRFKSEVEEFCPPLRGIELPGDPCLDATISYLTELKKCEADNRTEDECWEARSHAANTIVCAMQIVAESRRHIGDWFGRLRPPKPIPWLE